MSRVAPRARLGRLRATTGTTTAIAGAATATAPDPRAGATFLAALTEVAGLLRAGADPAAAWRHGMGLTVVDGVPRLPDLVAWAGGDVATARAVLAAARLSAELGVAPAQVLDRVVASLALSAEEAGQRAAALAGPRATARLLVWLPALGLVLGLALGADPVGVLLDGGAGTALLVAGLALTILGRRWTARYLRAAADAGADP